MPAALPPVQISRLAACLQRVVHRCDVPARLSADPVGIVRQIEGADDRELVALLAAALAFGNVKTLRASILDALSRLATPLAARLDDPVSTRRALRGFRHRMIRDVDLGRLLVGARVVQRKHGSLGACFSHHLSRSRGELRSALAQWVVEVREEAGLRDCSRTSRRGPAHVLPNPHGTSGCKRLLLYLRWMVRADDGVDLGLWPTVPTSLLLVPVDTHILRLGVNLAMTDQRSPTWRAAEQITHVLRQIDPVDPVRFDFALCHLGMVQRCPESADPDRCLGCGIRDACRHWRPVSATAPVPRAARPEVRPLPTAMVPGSPGSVQEPGKVPTTPAFSSR
ncbi:MAG: TIGR02757 family protein [Polyangiaceae bacterium]|nr:TIGR02757 family protein [Polyangiaceae bacterium]